MPDSLIPREICVNDIQFPVYFSLDFLFRWNSRGSPIRKSEADERPQMLHETKSENYITLVLLQLLLAINVLSIQINEHLAKRVLFAVLIRSVHETNPTMNFFP